MTLLDRYLGRAVVGASLLVLLILVALSGFIVFVDQLHQAGQGNYGVGAALSYTLLTLPDQSLDLFPTAVLLGTLLGLGGLASSNELMVIRTAGIPTLRIAASALLGGLVMALLVAGIGEILSPPAKSHAEATREFALYGRIGSVGEDGIWARDGNLFINVRALVSQNLIRGIYIYRFDGRQLTRATHASEARFADGHWMLHNITVTTLHGTTATSATHRKSAEWATLLDPGLLRLFVVNPSNLSASGLLRYIGYLRHNGLDTTRYRIAFWSKIVRPFTVLAMVLLALPFVFGPLRSVATGQRMLYGIIIGVAFYIANTTTMRLGEAFHFNAILSASAPTVALALASLTAVARLR